MTKKSKNNIFYKIILTLILFLSFCKNNSIKNIENIKFDSVPLTYAKGFEISTYKQVTKLTIRNPWQKAKNIVLEYYLIPKNVQIPEIFKNKEFIKTPVERIVCFSTTHLAYIDLLRQNNSLVGLAGTEYVYNSKIRQLIDEKKIVDVGYDQNINYELILSLNPDVVFLYGIESEVSSRIAKFQSIGIKVVVVSEYLEQTPLAKTEWLKFFATFYNNLQLANCLFDTISNDYNQLLKITDTIKNRPDVLVNVPYNGIWFLPGGKSYLANLIKDAGGNYLWNKNTDNESFNLDFENIYLKGKNADYLINTGIYTTKNEILGIEKRISDFKVSKNNNIFNNNKRLNQNGGNDFWESGIVNPQIILKDLLKIFHNNIFLKDSLYFYRKLE